MSSAPATGDRLPRLPRPHGRRHRTVVARRLFRRRRKSLHLDTETGRRRQQRARHRDRAGRAQIWYARVSQRAVEFPGPRARFDHRAG
jgi:hypothetical protein